MKKYLLLIIFLLLPLSVFALEQESYAGVDYYIYKPEGATTATPVIFCFHGWNPSSSDMAQFGPYQQIQSINPNAVVVFPINNNTDGNGHISWNGSTYGNFIRSFISGKGFTGSVNYYGFSVGAINGVGIIQSAGIIKNAVLVDEDFIRSTGNTPDSIYGKLASLDNLKVMCGNECDSEDKLSALQARFSSAGKYMEYNANNGTSHGAMNGSSASPGIGFLVAKSSPGSGGGTIPSGGGSTPSGGTTNPSGRDSGTGGIPGQTTTGPTTTVRSRQAAGSGGTNGCPLGEEVTKDLSGALRVMRIMAPVFVITYTIFDVIVAISKGDAKAEGKNMLRKFLKRMLAAIILFFIPTLIDVLMQMFNVWDSTGHCTFTSASIIINTFK